MKNEYGLNRSIPSEVKRIIRQKSGFGCVICGNGIVEYEHVDPEFNQAMIHDPDCMTLLCPQCHSKVTSGMWSKQKVKNAMRFPKCFEKGYTNEIFDIGKGFPKIHFAGTIFENCIIPLMIGGQPVFKVEHPTEKGEPYLLSADFTDERGNKSLSIIKNEWIAYLNNWDIEVIGPVITIREQLGEIHLQLKANPPDTISVTKLKMKINCNTVVGDENKFTVKNHLTKQEATISKSGAQNSYIGFSIF